MELTGIWPPLPIIINNLFGVSLPRDYDLDAAVVHHNRVREISLNHLTSSQLERLVSAMQDRFPALIHLMLGFYEYGHSAESVQALPDGFLGGSAQHLQSLQLQSIPFPALPKLLLSATDLVRLTLWDIPHSGYISPETTVTNLAVLANLKSFSIGFKSRLSLPDQENRPPPPPKPTVLPTLTRFEFKGASEYLDDLVARFDAPLLNSISVSFFHQLIYDIPQLARFVKRTTRFQALNETHVDFGHYGIQVASLPLTRPFDELFGSGISSRELSWQHHSLSQIFTLFIPSICMVEHLYIYGRRQHVPALFLEDSDNVQWLEVLHPFTAVKNVYISWYFAPRIADALRELAGERATDVLPALESLFLEDLWPSGPVEKTIGNFVAARQLLGHPVAVSRWEREVYNDIDECPPYPIPSTSHVI
jgi:hypothetical protein